ncbi:unnamed protein product [Urochloa humidicola]
MRSSLAVPLKAQPRQRRRTERGAIGDALFPSLSHTHNELDGLRVVTGAAADSLPAYSVVRSCRRTTGPSSPPRWGEQGRPAQAPPSPDGPCSPSPPAAPDRGPARPVTRRSKVGGRRGGVAGEPGAATGRGPAPDGDAGQDARR